MAHARDRDAELAESFELSTFCLAWWFQSRGVFHKQRSSSPQSGARRHTYQVDRMWARCLSVDVLSHHGGRAARLVQYWTMARPPARCRRAEAPTCRTLRGGHECDS